MIYEPNLAPGCVPVSLHQRRRPRQTNTYELDVSFLLELSSDEGTHLGVLFPCVQRGTCRETQLQIGSAGLPEGGLSRFIIQNVIYELKPRE